MEPGRDLLTSLEVASPCRASWEAMSGDARVRVCDHCAKNVYNLSGMNRREAETLIRASEGRLCVRFYRRRDGTMLTDNCPVGLRAARRWARIHLAGISALLICQRHCCHLTPRQDPRRADAGHPARPPVARRVQPTGAQWPAPRAGSLLPE